MKAYGSVASRAHSTIDQGAPLPVASRSGRTVLDDLSRLEVKRARLSPVQIQPLTPEETEALYQRVQPKPRMPAVARTRKPAAPKPARAPRKPTPVRDRVTRIDQAQVATLYQSGLHVAAVATAVGCSPGHVRRILTMAGVVRRDDRTASTPGPRATSRARASYRAGKARVDVAAIVAAYEAGQSTSQVAALLGCTARTVRYRLREAGVVLRDDRAAHAGQRASAIVEAYEAGQTPPQIAALLGSTPKTVRSYLRAAGVVLRDDRAGHSGSSKKVDPPTDVAQLRELYVERGHSIAEVAALLGSTPKVIQCALVRNRIPRRPAAARVPADNAAELKARMAAAGVTSAQVRGWAQATGRPCAPQGLPPAHLVQTYVLLLRLSPQEVA